MVVSTSDYRRGVGVASRVFVQVVHEVDHHHHQRHDGPDVVKSVPLRHCQVERMLAQRFQAVVHKGRQESEEPDIEVEHRFPAVTQKQQWDACEIRQSRHNEH